MLQEIFEYMAWCCVREQVIFSLGKLSLVIFSRQIGHSIEFSSIQKSFFTIFKVKIGKRFKFSMKNVKCQEKKGKFFSYFFPILFPILLNAIILFSINSLFWQRQHFFLILFISLILPRHIGLNQHHQAGVRTGAELES